MMKRAILILILICLCISAWAQCPTGSITLSTQAQIDSFAADYPGCTEIPGHVIIGSAVTSLGGLNQITSIGGLTINGNYALTDLTGLNNLTSVGDSYILIRGNTNLTSLIGLENVTSIDGNLLIFRNNNLTNLVGLDNLTTVGGVFTIGRYITAYPSVGMGATYLYQVLQDSKN